jgi:hypothetical protein
MTHSDLTLAFDSNILTYFLDAASGTYDPASDADDKLRPQRIAAFRLFLYGPKLWIVPAVAEEVGLIGKSEVRDNHLSWIRNLFGEVLPEWLDERDVAPREARYAALHSSGKMDCKAVAEAESDGLHRFLTFDRKLLKNLAGKTERIIVQTPSECWDGLDIPKGTEPVWSPAPGNPLAAVDWWRW